MRRPVSFNFNNKNSWSGFKIKILNKVIIPFPKKQQSVIKIPGGEDLVIDEGDYEDITIPVHIDILDKRIIETKYRDLKRWLSLIEDNHLIFSNDPEIFYKVKNIDIPNFETQFEECGTATINFICSPYSYFTNGIEEIELTEYLFNFGINSKPVFNIKGEGVITLIINNKEVEFNVGQELIIDVDKKLVYKKGLIQNLTKKGSWEDLKLQEGDNTLSYKIAPGSRLDSITIIPNWRTL